MDELKRLREEITSIDDEMAALFARRMAVSSQIASCKIRMGKAVYDPVREAENLEKAKTRVPEEIAGLYRDFLQNCMDLSKEYQKMKTEENA